MRWIFLVILAVVIFLVYKSMRKRKLAQNIIEDRNARERSSNASKANAALNKNSSGTQTGAAGQAGAHQSSTASTNGAPNTSGASNANATSGTNNVAGSSSTLGNSANANAAGQSGSNANTTDSHTSVHANTQQSAHTNTTTDNSSSGGVAGIAAAAGVAGGLSAVALAGNSSGDNNNDGAASSAAQQVSITPSGEAANQSDPNDAILANSEQAGFNNTNLGSEEEQLGLELENAPTIDASELAAAGAGNYAFEEEEDDIDIGDMTIDISEMIKELNLRETDSPRLDVNTEEYAQLKTGEPGQVQPKKIENVAGKLRKMLS